MTTNSDICFQLRPTAWHMGLSPSMAASSTGRDSLLASLAAIASEPSWLQNATGLAAGMQPRPQEVIDALLMPTPHRLMLFTRFHDAVVWQDRLTAGIEGAVLEPGPRSYAWLDPPGYPVSHLIGAANAQDGLRLDAAHHWQAARPALHRSVVASRLLRLRRFLETSCSGELGRDTFGWPQWCRGPFMWPVGWSAALLDAVDAIPELAVAPRVVVPPGPAADAVVPSSWCLHLDGQSARRLMGVDDEGIPSCLIVTVLPGGRINVARAVTVDLEDRMGGHPCWPPLPGYPVHEPSAEQELAILRRLSACSWGDIPESALDVSGLPAASDDFEDIEW